MTVPSVAIPSFKCPHCEIVAQQSWRRIGLTGDLPGSAAIQIAYAKLPDDLGSAGSSFLVWSGTAGAASFIDRWLLAICSNCSGVTLWLTDQMIHPLKSTAPEANPDMPEAARKDYEEAAFVLPYSPRASAALLRLSTEKLLGYILQKADGIDAMIADFVKRGVSSGITNAMDVLRVTGNEAVHPGTMTNIDDQTTALSLFTLVNLIVETQITQPKHIDAMFNSLPQNKLQGIAQRNDRALRDGGEKS